MSSLTAKKVKQGVHRFVAAAWIGPTEGMEVHHKNGDPLDNRPSNLVIVTPNEHTELHRGGDVAGPGVPRVKAEKDLGSTSDWEDIV